MTSQARTYHALYTLKSGEVIVESSLVIREPAELGAVMGEMLTTPDYRIFKGVKRGGYLVLRNKDIDSFRLIPEDPEKLFPEEWLQMTMVDHDDRPVFSPLIDRGASRD